MLQCVLEGCASVKALSLWEGQGARCNGLASWRGARVHAVKMPCSLERGKVRVVKRPFPLERGKPCLIYATMTK